MPLQMLEERAQGTVRSIKVQGGPFLRIVAIVPNDRPVQFHQDVDGDENKAILEVQGGPVEGAFFGQPVGSEEEGERYLVSADGNPVSRLIVAVSKNRRVRMTPVGGDVSKILMEVIEAGGTA